ncbi:VOC family protein [Devosia sp. CN2-171]|uniref:VOC family protein n=1 Tax=Devosia sp. CN2-171 TaxID=3400909 RepID=UPI003BF8AAE5
MRTLNYILLAVRDPLKSADLYTPLLGREPVEKATTFVLYVLPTGLKIGLWLADEMEPRPNAAGGVEISFTEDSKDAVRASFEEWKTLGLKIVQEPTDMDFGYTFVAEDLDGHRLRPFVPADNPR